MIDLNRIAINQATTKMRWGFRQAVEGYARHGVRVISIWNDTIDGMPINEVRSILTDNQMSVSGVNRVGPFHLSDKDNSKNFDLARKAFERAQALGADCMLFFPGALPDGSKDLDLARSYMGRIIEKLLPIARDAGVTLALEPLHPMLAGHRSCLTSLSAANDLCDAFGEGLGIVVDVYHVWWEHDLRFQIDRASGSRIVGFHVSDWLVPTRDLVFDRGMMGDGIIDIRAIRKMVDKVGYRGPIEVEIFSNENWWKRDPDDVVKLAIDRCRTIV